MIENYCREARGILSVALVLVWLWWLEPGVSYGSLVGLTTNELSVFGFRVSVSGLISCLYPVCFTLGARRATLRLFQAQLVQFHVVPQVRFYPVRDFELFPASYLLSKSAFRCACCFNRSILVVRRKNTVFCFASVLPLDLECRTSVRYYSQMQSPLSVIALWSFTLSHRPFLSKKKSAALLACQYRF